MEASKTRNAIFEACVELFASKGYAETSMREIAQVVGIKPASIYNHYASKQDIVETIFDRYEELFESCRTPPGELKRLVGKESPQEIFRRTIIVYPPEVSDFMANALQIASRLSMQNDKASHTMYEMLLLTKEVDKELLEEMLKLDVIEPINVEAFATLHSSFCYFASIHFMQRKTMSPDSYMETLNFLFDTLKIKNQE